MKDWLCCNCLHVGSLDKHGRCPVCQSDAVDVAVRPPLNLLLPEGRAAQILELQRIAGER